MSIRTKLLLSYIAMIIVPFIFFMITILFVVGFVMDRGTLSEGKRGMPFAHIRQLFSERNQFASGVAFLAQYDPKVLSDPSFLEGTTDRLSDLDAGLVLYKAGEIQYRSPNIDSKLDPLAQMEQEKRDPHRSWGPPWFQHGDGDGGYSDNNGHFAAKVYAFTYPEGEQGTMVLVTDMQPIKQFFSTMVPIALLTLLVGLALTNGLLTYLVSRSLIKPIYRLKDATEQIMLGNLDHELQLQRKDEIGELGVAFDTMRSRLQQSLIRQLAYEDNRKELLSNISHDLRTPITAIQGCVDCLRDGIADSPEKQDKYIQMIAQKTSDMDRMIDELFIYSKLDLKQLPFHFEPLDLAGYLRNCYEELLLHPNMEGTKVEFSYTGREPLLVMADREKLERVLWNIINNSLAYMVHEPRQLGIRLEARETEAIVTVTDNGTGIDQQAIASVFDRFFRAEASRNSATGGSGLGLAIVKQMIEGHGGRVWVESRVNEGTTIGFSLRMLPDKGGEQN